MDNTKIFLLIVLVICVIALWGLIQRPPSETVTFTSLEDCKSSCEDMGYTEAMCLWPTEAESTYVNLGSCLVQQSRHCGNVGQCNCYCYNITEEYCIKTDSGERMSLSEAKQIALASECGDRLKDTYMCNEDTGTWWIDLDIEKEGCNPACVINVVTKEAEINWRCTGVIACAKDGEKYSQVYEEYPEHCCEGLKEWLSGFDTRISIADVCYETGLLAGSPIGICIKCGDGICGDIENPLHHPNYLENPCNCPEDCAGKNKSDFLSIEEFCQSNDWDYSFSKACEETIKDFPICKLC